MSTDIITNQASKDVLSKSVAATAQPRPIQNRQTVSVAEGNNLPPEQSKPEVSAEELQKVVEQLNQHVQMIQRDLQFSVDEDSGHTVVRVVNAETKELVRQIPSEEVLRISRTIKEQLDDTKGLIFQTSA